MELNRIYNWNVLDTPWSIEDNSIDCCVTSPPYWGLRDYNNPDQIGLEDTPEEYVQKMVKVFSEVNRVLKPSGVLWLNLGDSYAGNGGQYSSAKSTLQGTQPESEAFGSAVRFKKRGGLKAKDLVGIPWTVAFALRSAGWYLRQDIIWSKPNPMPESVTDRCTKAHEYIFLLTKSKNYYYDAAAIRQPLAESSMQRLSQDLDHQDGSDRVPGKTNGTMKAVGSQVGANKRSVWTVATVPFKEAHFATFPEELITPCILAGCPSGGTVLDPFMGAGTTALVAKSNDRNFIGFELNPDYIKIADERLKQKFGMFHKSVICA